MANKPPIRTTTDWMLALAGAIEAEDVGAVTELRSVTMGWLQDAAARDAQLALLEAAEGILQAIDGR
jgi:hypothetical protein